VTVEKHKADLFEAERLCFTPNDMSVGAFILVTRETNILTTLSLKEEEEG
jgi:hypothetical protein